jgi:hypothetical protein
LNSSYRLIRNSFCSLRDWYIFYYYIIIALVLVKMMICNCMISLHLGFLGPKNADFSYIERGSNHFIFIINHRSIYEFECDLIYSKNDFILYFYNIIVIVNIVIKIEWILKPRASFFWLNDNIHAPSTPSLKNLP